MSKFYVTTPIYYVNDKPHIGHAYTTLLADVLARSHRLLGDDTFFLTGTDEHGQKVDQAAAKRGVSPQQHCDEYVQRFQELWARLDITHDRFIRTTEEGHKAVVAAILQDLYERDEIYKASYEGWYAVSEERFVTEKDVTEQTDEQGRRLAQIGEMLKPVERISEDAYYFRMSRYQDWLIGHIEANPTFIQPDFRRNETLGFLKSQPLADLCISRPKNRLSWGIELPFDADYVTYVWFDALVNYISGVDYDHADPTKADFTRWWPADYHLIGKDILTTHTVYWPTMLQAAGIPQPRCIFAHGWWLMKKSGDADDGAAEKMSKSLGNIVDPIPFTEQYGVDAFRYFLMADMVLGQDASYSFEQFVTRYNADLADNLGNMLNRVVKFIASKADGVVPAPDAYSDDDRALQALAIASIDALATAIGDMKIDRGLQSVMELVRGINGYFERNAPWKLAKAGDTARLGTVLYTAAEALRVATGLLFPVMPGKMAEARRALGVPDADAAPTLESLRAWGGLPAGAAVQDLVGLFPKIEVEKPAAEAKPAKQQQSKKQQKAAKAEAKPEGVAELLDFTDFAKVDLRTAKILAAEPVEGADRLLRLQLEVGDTRRQIVAGIAQHYAPEALIGRSIVIVANLKPAVIRGVESNGMLLAAKAGKTLRLIGIDGDIPSGASVG